MQVCHARAPPRKPLPALPQPPAVLLLLSCALHARTHAHPRALAGHDPSLRFITHLRDPLSPGFRPLAFYLLVEGAAAFSGHMLRQWGFRRHQSG
jgi:hypothetical protein